MCLIVRRLAITHHGHDIGKRSTGTVVFVSVEENTKTLEVIRRAKDRALCSSLLGEPQGESITVQVAVPVEFEFEFNLAPIRTIAMRHSEREKRRKAHLPIRRRQRNSRENPSLLRWPVRSKTNVPSATFSSGSNKTNYRDSVHVLISANDSISTKIEPAALEIRIQVWL